MFRPLICMAFDVISVVLDYVSLSGDAFHETILDPVSLCKFWIMFVHVEVLHQPHLRSDGG